MLVDGFCSIDHNPRVGVPVPPPLPTFRSVNLSAELSGNTLPASEVSVADRASMAAPSPRAACRPRRHHLEPLILRAPSLSVSATGRADGVGLLMP
jgi:hypothetical protein